MQQTCTLPLHVPAGQQESTLQPSTAAIAGESPAPCSSIPQWIWEESNDAVKAYAVFFGWLALGTLPQVQSLAGSAGRW